MQACQGSHWRRGGPCSTATAAFNDDGTSMCVDARHTVWCRMPAGTHAFAFGPNLIAGGRRVPATPAGLNRLAPRVSRIFPSIHLAISSASGPRSTQSNMARALFSLAALLGLLAACSASPDAIVSVNDLAQAAVRASGIQSQIASRVGTAAGAAAAAAAGRITTSGPLAATQTPTPACPSWQIYALVHLAQFQAIEEGAEEAVQAAQAGACSACKRRRVRCASGGLILLW